MPNAANFLQRYKNSAKSFCVAAKKGYKHADFNKNELFLNDLYEHHCYREYCDNLNESSEGFFWEKFYQTDSEQGSDSYYRKHQEVLRERTPGDVVPGKDLERNLHYIDNQEEPGVNADVFHLLLSHREQINRHYRSGSIANHRGETAEQSEEGRIPPFMHPSVSLICDALKDSFLRYIGFSEKYS